MVLGCSKIVAVAYEINRVVLCIIFYGVMRYEVPFILARVKTWPLGGATVLPIF